MRAIVIGAGLAGLAAADALQAAGADVVVLDARRRVGGRVWSRTLANGAVVEMGAEFVLPGNDLVRELAARFGLGLWQKGMRYGQREPRGGIGVAPAALAAGVAAVGRALDEPDAQRESAADLLRRVELDPGAREAITARVEVSAATSANEVPAAALAGIAHISADPSPSVAGGNQRLALALAAGIGRAVELDAPARRIRWRKRGVEVGIDAGGLQADACVVAVPASVVGRIDFEPALPTPARRAFGGVRYGHAAKLFVPLRGAAPPSAVLSVPERYWTWTATGRGDEPQLVVSAFAGSPAALRGLGVSEGPKRWLESVARLRPDLDLEPEGAVLATWDDDPWLGAAYSVAPPAELVRPLLGVIGPLAFAGEHTAGEFSGLMEGALRSGRRAARALLGAVR